MAELVFVYGSLKRGLLHHDQMRGAEFLGEASLLDHRLVLYEESYPALCEAPGSGERVLGELFSVSKELLCALDRFEEVPTLYQRTRVTTTEGLGAFAYIIGAAVAAAYPTHVGPWLGRRQH